MNAEGKDAPPDHQDADREPPDAWLEEHLLAEWNDHLFVPNGRVAREAAIVFMLLTHFDFISFTVEDIAATFLWDISRAERALDRLDDGLIEGHRRQPELIAPMVIVRDPQRVWICCLPQPPASLGRLR